MTSIPKQIQLCEPDVGELEQEFLAKAIQSGFVSSVGPFVKSFSQRFAQVVGAEHAIPCSSGTAAIHLALLSVGVGPGDLVLCSDFTFIASANPAKYLGADIGLIDVDPLTWNMDANVLKSAIRELSLTGSLPKAVVVVHVYGAPADLGAVLEVCAEWDIPVIEDAAEALGACYKAAYPNERCANSMVGIPGHIGCFSFNGNKIITSGGGGMVVTQNASFAAKIRHLSTQARLPGAGYKHDRIGYNYRMTNIAAAVGYAQLLRLDEFLESKHRIWKSYEKELEEVQFQTACEESRHNCWLPTVLVKNQNLVLESLRSQGIMARPAWTPLHMQLPYKGCRRWGGKVSAAIGANGVSLPASVGLKDEEVSLVIGAVRRAL